MGVSRAAELRPVALRLSVNCSGCGRTVALAGPLRAVRCPACDHQVVTPASVWLELLGLADRESFAAPPAAGVQRHEVQTPAGRFKLELTFVAPCCDPCALPLGLLETGATGKASCARCAATLYSQPAPLWLRHELATAMQIYAPSIESADGATRAVDGRVWVIFQGTPPSLREKRNERLQAEAQERAAISNRLLAEGPAPVVGPGGPMFPIGVVPEKPPNRTWLVALILVVLVGLMALKLMQDSREDDVFGAPKKGLFR